MDTKGLVQETGSGVTLEQGALTRTISHITATVNTANGTTTTDLGITPPAGSRALGWKIEVLEVTGAVAGNITDLGIKGVDDDAISGTIALAGNAVASLAGAAVAATRDIDMPATELMITHGDPGAEGRSSKVRVTVLLETWA
ncbi:MAG: hypothetical protein CMB77_04210 [Euryarchaeota archaeon]|nr:hypothetical protein [Euryarchaeota archaeon]|tara:strand:+ start:660 stop:1088 length:429 start_codon:yes stop_codon:yes gene_type:complete